MSLVQPLSCEYNARHTFERNLFSPRFHLAVTAARLQQRQALAWADQYSKAVIPQSNEIVKRPWTSILFKNIRGNQAGQTVLVPM